MKTILCYGDSNTWGIDYQTGGRVPFQDRWVNVMQRELGAGYRVIEEGLNGRTTAEDDPSDEYPAAKNGKCHLIPCLRSHYPLDLVILMLGTNDLKLQFFTSVGKIAENLGDLAEMAREELRIRQNRAPEILLAAPMVIGDTIRESVFCAEFGGEQAIAPSRELAGAIRKEAQRRSCFFINAAEIARPNSVDAVHFTAEGHRQFGKAAARKVREILV